MQPRISDTKVLSCAPVKGVDGAMWKCVEIEAPGISFAPGQYIMAAAKIGAVNWPSPLMIQQASACGVIALIHPNSPLYVLEEGALVTVWGPCGTGIAVGEESTVLLTDGPGWLLVAPYAKAYPSQCTALLYGAAATSGMHEGISVSSIDSFAKVSQEETVKSAARVIVALPLKELSQLLSALPKDIAGKVSVFVGTRVACGLGACKSCFITGGGVSYGIAVCKEGPFLKAPDIDFARDQDSLLHYV